MAQNSLGKKTHLPAVLNLFWTANRIWPQKGSIALSKASEILQDNADFAKSFTAKQWPRDIRSIQAYVHRFFRWLELPASQRSSFPTVVLSAGDSVAFRQSLWLDFVSGTPEAERAVLGLWNTLQQDGLVEISPRTHTAFCRWVGIPTSDNTRRGPFARWLEEAGLGFAIPDRSVHETGIVVPRADPNQVSPEAFVYGIYMEFAKPFDGGALSPIEVPLTSVEKSLTLKALMLAVGDVGTMVSRALALGYAKRLPRGLGIDSIQFSRALTQSGPLPSPSWVMEEIPEGEPITKAVLEELVDFPLDDCFATDGSPFDVAAKLEAATRRRRDGAFVSRIGDAYKHRCVISGEYFRSPTGCSWYGDAVHIVPHSGKSKDGSAVFGKSVLSNGLFMTKFNHWCFDRGWFTIDPIRRVGQLKGYKLRVATAAVDDFFEHEGGVLLSSDGQQLPTEWLPNNPRHWPSLKALEWHRTNMFHG